MEARHRVDHHIAASPEAEPVFALFSIADGKGLVGGIELRGEVGHLHPTVFTVDGPLYHKGRVAFATHEGSHTAVVSAFLGRELQHFTALDAQGRRHQVVVRIFTAAQEVCDVETAGLFRILPFLSNVVLDDPTFGKPAVGHLPVIETLVHLSRGDVLGHHVACS